MKKYINGLLLIVVLFSIVPVIAESGTEQKPAQNAFEYYRRAGDSLKNLDRMLQFYKNGVTPPGLEEKRAVVRENAPALAMLREGFAYPCCCPSVSSFNEKMPYLAQFRNLSRLLKLEGEVKAAGGDWTGGTESCLDTVYLGKDLQHGAALLGNLVGIACQAIGRKPAWGYLPHLTAEQARQEMKRMQAIEADRVPLSTSGKGNR